MADTEEYFPRGGKKPTTLYKQNANFLGAPEKTEKKKKKLKKKSDGDDGYLSDEVGQEIDQSSKNCAVGLSYKTIKEGVLVLGRIRYVYDTRMAVMLPCRIIGNVMACHISDPYNKMLEAYVNDQADKVSELTKMFRPGQYVALKVLEHKEKNLMLSAMPQHVNGGKGLADIVKGALFQAAVVSVEDHGFVMDLGIPNTTTFLPKKDVSPDLQLDMGMITWCAVKSVTPSTGKSVVTVSCALGAVQGALLKNKPTGPLLPGTNVEFTVDTPLENGIEGTIFGDTTSYVQRQHVDKVKGKKPTLGQKIRCRVLYVLPTRNAPFLTIKNIFETTFPDMEAEQTLKDGDIIEDAQVLKIINRAVHMKLGGGRVGVLSVRRIEVDEERTDEEVVAKSYPVGSKHKVRVLCYNMSDYVYSVTDQPHIVDEPYFSLEGLAVGQIVAGTVSAVLDKHAEVQVGRCKGYVPHTHLSEAGVFIDPKKARVSTITQKKYKVGQKVQARILSIDPSKQHLVLTMKPSLLAADLEILQNYEEAEIGKAYTGVVRYIGQDYLLVSFFNNATAYIPRNFISNDRSQQIQDAFHLGQIVNCTILSVKLDTKRMSGSLTTAPFSPDENRQKVKRKQKNSECETPHKKQKTDEQSEKKEIKTEETAEPDKAEKKKKKKRESETSNVEESLESETKSTKKKKKLESESSTIEKDIETNVKTSKKKKKRDSESSKAKEPTESDTVIGKRKKKHDSETSNADEYINSYLESTNKVQDESESDAIETDMYEQEELLTPHEQGLLDTSDCITIKDFKKRVVAISKAIDVRIRRSNVIDEKITHLEDKGLNARNKKYHTAMQIEKLTIQERVDKLTEAREEIFEKLKELGYEKKENYKEEQKARKLEKKLAKKAARLEAKQEKKNAKKHIEKESKSTIKQDSESEKDDQETDVKDIKAKIKGIKIAESLEPALEVPSAKDFFFGDATLNKPSVTQDDSSSSDEETTEQPKKKRKKLSVAEKLSKVRADEERIRALERAAAEGGAPRSVDQFERALLADPSSSQLWIAYMAFHLQSTELDKARAVARKALAAIPFREELDKLNVWLSLLNLEHRFGTKESQQKTLEEALQLNDPYKVHTALLDIYVETGCPELSSLAELVLRKYKSGAACVAAGGACYRAGRVEKARQLMQKGITQLEKKEHVSILVQFALLERRHGGRERAEALFEQVLAVYPQRVDVCSTYVDMLLKDHDVELARQVLERMTSLKLPARKMKILYKKWIEVEEKFGDEAQAETIRQKAMEFIDKAKF